MTHQTGGVLAYSDVNYFFLSEYVLQFIRVARMPIEKVQFTWDNQLTSTLDNQHFLPRILPSHHFSIRHLLWADENGQIQHYFVCGSGSTCNFGLQRDDVAVNFVGTFRISTFCYFRLNSLSKSDVLTDKEAFAYMTRTIYYNEEYREFGYLTLNRLQVIKR